MLFRSNFSTCFGDQELLPSIALSVAEYGSNVNGICPGVVMSDMFNKFYKSSRNGKEKTGHIVKR